MSIFSRILSHIPGFRNDASISETSSVTGKKTQHTAERSENKTTSVDRKFSKRCLNNATKSAQHKVKKQHAQPKKTHHHNKQGKVLSPQGNQPEKTHLKDSQLAKTIIKNLENFDENYTFEAIQQLSTYTDIYPDFTGLNLNDEDKKNIILYISKNYNKLINNSIFKKSFDEKYDSQKVDLTDIEKLKEIPLHAPKVQNTLLNNLSKIFAALDDMDFSIFNSPSNEYQKFRKDTSNTLKTLNNLTIVLYKLNEFQENNKTPNKYLMGRLNQISEKVELELIRQNVINDLCTIIDNPTSSKKELKSQTIFNHYNSYRKYYDEKYNKRSLPLLNPKLERSPEKNLNNLKSNIQAFQQQGIINDSQAKNFLAEISRKINQLALEKFVKDFKSIPKNLQEKNFKKYLSNMTTYVQQQGNPMNLSTFLEDQKNSKVVPATFFVNFRNFISNLKDSDITKDFKNNLLKNSPNVPVFPIENPHPKPKVVKPAKPELPKNQSQTMETGKPPVKPPKPTVLSIHIQQMNNGTQPVKPPKPLRTKFDAPLDKPQD